MKNEIIANSCRVCLTKTKKLRSLYKPIDEGDEPPNKMLQLITGIMVEKLDEYETLPKNICKNCELSLSMAFEFRENALRTQEIIAAHLKQFNEIESDNDNDDEKNKNTISMFKSDYEEMLSLEHLDCAVVLQGDMENLSNEQNKFNVDNDLELNNNESNEKIEKQQIEEEFIDHQEVSCFINDSKEDRYEENSVETYFSHPQNEEYTETEPEDFEVPENFESAVQQFEITPIKVGDLPLNETDLINPKSTNTKTLNKIITNVKEELHGTDFTENHKMIPRRGRKPSSANDLNGHVCDICGNVFAKRGRMMEHRQRHNKECRFCCEICPQKFRTRELLRKHMFSHSGGKPLKCAYCSRTFYYESVRKTHEAVHKGLRPYVCEICDKSFSYAHALKKHQLIHAEIKLYRCEYCNKDFRLQHHMKQHELTKLHQNTVRFAQNHKNDSMEQDDDENYLNQANQLVECCAKMPTIYLHTQA